MVKLQAIVPLIGLFINVSSQVLIYRHIKQSGLLKSEYLGFLIGLLAIFIFKPQVFPAGIFITNLITYCALSYCYFHFVNLGETARRIRIMRELAESDTGLSLDDLLQRYNAQEIVERRMGRLLANGQIILRDGRYYIGKPIVLWMAKILLFMKRVILSKKCAF